MICVPGTDELGSGGYIHSYVTEPKIGDDDGYDVDDSDYDIYIDDVSEFMVCSTFIL